MAWNFCDLCLFRLVISNIFEYAFLTDCNFINYLYFEDCKEFRYVVFVIIKHNIFSSYLSSSAQCFSSPKTLSFRTASEEDTDMSAGTSGFNKRLRETVSTWTTIMEAYKPRYFN